MADPEDAISKINKGQDKKEDMMLMISSQAGWDHFLTPAPLAISLMGELIFVSTKTDFSLTERPPTDGFKFLRHPDSFRACLVQVSNEGWSAFNEAHTNMDQIRLYSSNVEKHVKNAVKFLMGGSPEEVKRMVPVSLKKVSEIADSCLGLATGIEDKFVRVMHVTGELLESCAAVKGTYEQRYKDTETALQIAKTQEKEVRRSREEMRERCTTLQKDIDEAHLDFKEAMDQIPTRAESIAYTLTEGIIAGVKGVLNMLPFLGNKTVTIVNTPTGTQTETSSTESKEILVRMTEKHKAYTTASQICPLIRELAVIATVSSRNGEQYPELSEDSRQRVKCIKEKLICIQKRIDELVMDTTPKRTGSKLCGKGVNICECIDSLFSTISGDENCIEGKSIVSQISKLNISAEKFNIKAKEKTGTHPLDTKSPNTAKYQEPVSSENLLDSRTKVARFKTETAKAVLRDAQRRHDEAYNQMREENERLEKIIAGMAKLNIDEVDFDSIRKTLTEGIKALAGVREQWGKLVQFFQMMSNLIKCSLHTSLKDFVDYSEEGRALKIGNLPLSATFRDLIFEQATEANRVAYAVQVISSTYVNVSSEHLMDRVTKLNQLIAINPSNTSEIVIKRNDLHSGTQAAQNAIKSIMQKKREEFDERLESRIRQIERDVEAVLPPLPANEIEAIQQAVKSGADQTEEDLEKEVDYLVWIWQPHRNIE